MALYVEQIATSRYAPQGSEKVYLYANGLEGGQHLTLGQLVIAVSMRSAAEYEAQSVVKMNRMAGGVEQLNKVAEFMDEIANGGGDWAAIKTYCQTELGIKDELPDAIDTYAKRMAAIAALKTKANALTQQQQTDMIDMQTLVNRRDEAFSTASDLMGKIGDTRSNAIRNM